MKSTHSLSNANVRCFPNELEKIKVSWIPAHPSCGVESMRRCWKQLSSQISSDDGFQIKSLAAPDRIPSKHGLLFRINREWHRSVVYPHQIKSRITGQIAHLLDHSWADMLPYVPESMIRIVTVHDLFPLVCPGNLSDAQINRFRKRVSHLRNADHLIAVSEYTKSQVIELLQIPENHISVVPQGVTFLQKPVGKTRISVLLASLREKFIVVGSIGADLARKNLEILPPAFSIYKSYGSKPIALIRVGAKLPEGLAAELTKILGSEAFVELGRLDDCELEEFYSGIEVAVVPSTHEGFGLPVLEAMAAGAAVICSNSSCLPEVAGDAALFFTPTDPAGLALALRKLNDQTCLEEMRQRGSLRAKNYTWRSTLEQTFQVYRRLLDE